MKTPRELTRELRKRGDSYDYIAEFLGISKRDAHKYAKDVQVLKRASVRAEKTPKKRGKGVSGEDLQKTDSQMLARKTLRRLAELRSCGEMSEDKFVYDMNKEFGMKCKEYEKKIPSMRGFIPSAYQHLWSFYFDSFAEIIEEEREDKRALRDELREDKKALRKELKGCRDMISSSTKKSFDAEQRRKKIYGELERLLEDVVLLLRKLENIDID